MDLPVVTPENYYSPEMNMAYMGSTQFKAFEKCEAAALAELRGEYTPSTSQAFLIGGYIDAWFSGELPLYQAQHPEIFKRDGTLKAEYVKAAEIVARLQADELYSMLMSGKKQVIRTGFIAGVPFKVKIDSLLDANTCNMIANRWPHTAAALGFCDGAIVDQKIMRDTAEVWSEEDHCRLPFVEAYDDASFFQKCGEIGEKVGFTWGGRWKSFPDRPHFQWDDNKQHTSAMIRAGKLPRQMPAYKAASDLSGYRAKIQAKAGLSDATLDYLQAYKYGADLLRKLAAAMG